MGFTFTGAFLMEIYLFSSCRIESPNHPGRPFKAGRIE
jgi:hypothetical protein